jgi:hypothetical protein
VLVFQRQPFRAVGVSTFHGSRFGLPFRRGIGTKSWNHHTKIIKARSTQSFIMGNNPIKKTNKKTCKGKTAKTKAKAPIKKKMCHGMLQYKMMNAQGELFRLEHAKECVDSGLVNITGVCMFMPDIQNLLEPYDGDLDKALEKKAEEVRALNAAFQLYEHEDKDDLTKKEEDDEDGPSGGFGNAGGAGGVTSGGVTFVVV